MRKYLLLIICFASIQLKAQPFPETQITEFKSFVFEALNDLQQQKFKSLAMVLKSADGNTSEVLFYSISNHDQFELVHATQDLSAHKMYFDNYSYKKICDEYFLIKQDTSKLKVSFIETKLDSKLKLSVNKIEVPNCRTGKDSVENRTYLFDEKNRLVSISNVKRLIIQKSYTNDSHCRTIEYKMRCSSCGNANDISVVSIDTIQSDFSFSKENISATGYDYTNIESANEKYMNCDWEAENQKSKKVLFRITTSDDGKLRTAKIQSTELHNNELNITGGESSQLLFYYTDVLPTDVEDYIEKLSIK